MEKNNRIKKMVKSIGKLLKNGMGNSGYIILEQIRTNKKDLFFYSCFLIIGIVGGGYAISFLVWFFNYQTKTTTYLGSIESLWFGISTILTIGGMIIYFIFYDWKLGKKSSGVNKKPTPPLMIKRLGKENGVELDKKWILPFKNLSYHTLILGGTGGGKTYFIIKLINSLLNKRQGKVFMINGKYNPNLRNDIGIDKILYFSGGSETNKYNLFKDKSNGEIVSVLVEASNYSLHKGSTSGTQYHQERELNLWTELLKEMKLKKSKITLNGLEQFLQVALGKGTEFSEKKMIRVKLEPKYWFENKNLLDFQKSHFQTCLGIISKMKQVEWLSQDSSGVGVKEMLFGDIRFILFNVFTDNVFEAEIIKSLIYDFKINIFKNDFKKNPNTIILDEFGSFATNQILNLVEKGRDFGCEMVVASQSVSQLDSIGNTFSSTLFGNINTYFVFKNNDTLSTNFISQCFGTKQEYLETEQLDNGAITNKGSRKVVDSFISHPNELKNLLQGECVFRTILKENRNTTPLKIKIK